MRNVDSSSFCTRFRSGLMLPLLALLASGAARLPPVRGPWWTGLPPMQTTQVHGQTIRYYDVGNGPVLVLLHGLGSSAGFDWGAVIPELAKHYHVLAPDQLGFGSSAAADQLRSGHVGGHAGRVSRGPRRDPLDLAGESRWLIAGLYAVRQGGRIAGAGLAGVGGRRQAPGDETGAGQGGQ